MGSFEAGESPRNPPRSPRGQRACCGRDSSIGGVGLYVDADGLLHEARGPLHDASSGGRGKVRTLTRTMSSAVRSLSVIEARQ